MPKSSSSLISNNLSVNLAIIIPIYNEQDVLPDLFKRLNTVRTNLAKKNVKTYLIFVNDGSKDKSASILDEYVKTHKDSVAIHFTKNFGHQAALSAGYKYVAQRFGNMIEELSQKVDAEVSAPAKNFSTSNFYVVTIDADLQDPPELIEKMLDKAIKQNLDIVYARRRKRTEKGFKVITADLFYKLIQSISSVNIPFEVADFRLSTLQMVQEALKVKQVPRFWRGIFASLSSRVGFVYYNRKDREKGVTGYSLTKMLKLAITAVTGFGDKLPIFMGYGAGIVLTIDLLSMFVPYSSYTYREWRLLAWFATTVYVILVLMLLTWYKAVEFMGELPEYVVRRDEGDIKS